MMDLSAIHVISFSVDNILLLGMYVITGLYTIYTAVFYYHWKTYGTDIKMTGLTLILYFTTTIPLILFIVSIAYFA